jgi:hypothetical protein
VSGWILHWERNRITDNKALHSDAGIKGTQYLIYTPQKVAKKVINHLLTLLSIYFKVYEGVVGFHFILPNLPGFSQSMAERESATSFCLTKSILTYSRTSEESSSHW